MAVPCKRGCPPPPLFRLPARQPQSRASFLVTLVASAGHPAAITRKARTSQSRHSRSLKAVPGEGVGPVSHLKLCVIESCARGEGGVRRVGGAEIRSTAREVLKVSSSMRGSLCTYHVGTSVYQSDVGVPVYTGARSWLSNLRVLQQARPRGVRPAPTDGGRTEWPPKHRAEQYQRHKSRLHSARHQGCTRRSWARPPSFQF